MELFLIDALGPFFRGYEKKRINWSKIPFQHLYGFEEDDWCGVERELVQFVGEAAALGYNAVTLDDLAHLARHPLHEPEVAGYIDQLRVRFGRFFKLIRERTGMKIFLTSDVIPLTPNIEAEIGGDSNALNHYYRGLVSQILDDFPLIDGLILRIGESDGHDVEDPIRTRLHLRNAKETNRFLRELLPEFEKRCKTMIFRTWTVGAHRIGDLIWHRQTLDRAMENIDSAHFILSMKHGESDFFRYLPLNRSFFRVRQQKLIEFQARREYEGAGEYPSFIGWDCARFAHELADAENVVGMSVWCQTGGWHRFRRRAFLETNNADVWIRLNVAAAISVFRDSAPPEAAIAKVCGEAQSQAATELLKQADRVIRDLLYIGEFARQKLFFRRVRIPPLFHVYWDAIFINSGVRKIIRHFVKDSEQSLAAGEEAFRLFPRMIELAAEAGLPAEDIEHFRDFAHLLLLARRYYFTPFDASLVEEITAAKKAYKLRWPKDLRSRYRVKTSFEPFPVKRHTISLAANLLLRKQRGYRIIDRLFTLYLSGVAFRTFKPRDPNAMPKFLRKSAMGVDAVFR